MKKAKIIHMVLLVTEGKSGESADAINEALRPATQHDNGLIVDYAFNSDGNFPDLPAPIPYEIADDYEEGQFTEAFNRK